MKKAKEYAKEIIAEYVEKTDKDALIKAAHTVKELFGECKEIENVRGVKTYSGILSVLKEQHFKWVAICRQVNKEISLLNERAFLDVIEEKMTMIYHNLIQSMQHENTINTH